MVTYNLFSPSKSRDLHKEPIPSILGVGFSVLFVIGTLFYSKTFENQWDYNALVASVLILMIIGLRDDLKVIKSSEKMLFQIVAISITLYYSPNLLADNLNGFLGINNIPSEISYPFTIFIGIAMINSFNLIDGIDGNAAIIGIISFICFGVFFLISDNTPFLGISILICGMLIAYLPINFSKHKKGFMGDTGSMFLGFMLFICTLVFINTESIYLSNVIPSKSLLVLGPLSIFAIPIIDTISIYTYRIRIGKSPFAADNFHIHHMVIRLFNTSHLISSLFLGLAGLLIVFFMSIIITYMTPSWSIFIYFLIITMCVLISFRYRQKLRNKLGLGKGNIEVID